MMDLLASPEAWVSFLTLAALEIVLGIDNIVFISILASRLPAEAQHKARKLGLGFALISRLLLLFSIRGLMGLTAPLFTLFDVPFSGRALILLGGGLFLVGKSTVEIYASLEAPEGHGHKAGAVASLGTMLVQIALLDLVFSLDSVITAIGMVDHVGIMAAAMIVAVVVMMVFANPIGDFVIRHPSMKILALAFLILVGVTLVMESLGQHVNKGYIYFSMAFSLGVELVNMRLRKAHTPVKLRERAP